nr:hypothetical protein Ade03nite_28590 [Actinoplanes derwentensis]
MERRVAALAVEAAQFEGDLFDRGGLQAGQADLVPGAHAAVEAPPLAAGNLVDVTLVTVGPDVSAGPVSGCAGPEFFAAVSGEDAAEVGRIAAEKDRCGTWKDQQHGERCGEHGYVRDRHG